LAPARAATPPSARSSPSPRPAASSSTPKPRSAASPPEAWAYKLGNRTAIDWVLDQHKERKPKDPTIRAKFDTYRFADHKEAVVALLARVITVSLGTQAIVAEIQASTLR